MNFISEHILKNPPVLLGLIAMLGLIIQRKSFSETIKGALTAGVNMLVGTISPINVAVQTQLGVEVTEGLSDVTFTAEYGGTVGLAMFLGLVIHLLIARFTPVKTIFLTGHMLWWFPFVFVAAGVEAGLSGGALIGISGILSACYWSFMPWIMRKYVWDATGDDSFLIGHPTGVLSLVSGFVAKRVGNKEKSTEDIKVPENLSFFREISITGALVMFLMNTVVGIIAPVLIPEGDNLLMFSIEAGLNFGAGLLIMLYGVRLLINQIIPAFQGIAEKVVPGAKPAFDVPILFNYRPNAVIIGFIVAMITSTILVVLANSFHLFGVLLVPLVITSFFECGGAAVIGEGQGGFRGAVVGTIAASFVMVVLAGFSAIVFSTTIQSWILIFGGNDLSLWGMIGRGFSGLFGGF
ncbi:PTS ascorbate transporter subunit IIC [Enterococcus faecium]|uniref:PTS ascorbate transporter subunit IIC n=1 Tax=Enterococcus faecium TaxID=1352 RepID=UPI000CF20B5D|nr:PTS ascorbate transporter subunit IIC [Enterococcus faecium]PQF02876.1 PTS ascorbate transporter subunit IIC [Enterococcus faecium]